MAVIFRKIRSASRSTIGTEDYEYTLFWLSPSGGVRQWPFSSTLGRKNEAFRHKVIDTIADFRSIPNRQEITIDMFSRSLSRAEFDYVSSIFESDRIFMYKKSDGSRVSVAIERSRKRTLRRVKDYSVEFEIRLKEPELMNA